MDGVLPEEILWRLGKREQSILNGPYWIIDPKRRRHRRRANISRVYRSEVRGSPVLVTTALRQLAPLPSVRAGRSNREEYQ